MLELLKKFLKVEPLNVKVREKGGFTYFGKDCIEGTDYVERSVIETIIGFDLKVKIDILSVDNDGILIVHKSGLIGWGLLPENCKERIIKLK